MKEKTIHKTFQAMANQQQGRNQELKKERTAENTIAARVLASRQRTEARHQWERGAPTGEGIPMREKGSRYFSNQLGGDACRGKEVGQAVS